MTDIDRQADLEVHFAGQHMTVRLPLAGPVTGEWLQHYQQLALAAQVRAQAGTDHDSIPPRAVPAARPLGLRSPCLYSWQQARHPDFGGWALPAAATVRAMRVTGLGHASVLIGTANGSILTTDSARDSCRSSLTACRNATPRTAIRGRPCPL